MVSWSSMKEIRNSGVDMWIEAACLDSEYLRKLKKANVNIASSVRVM